MLFPTFSSLRFGVSAFMLPALIHLDMIFLQGDRYDAFQQLDMLTSSLASTICLKCCSIFSPVCVSGLFIKKKKSDLHRCVVLQFDSGEEQVCFYANTMHFYYSSSVVQLKSGTVIPLAVLLLYRIVLTNLFSFFFHTKLRIILSRSL